MEVIMKRTIKVTKEKEALKLAIEISLENCTLIQLQKIEAVIKGPMAEQALRLRGLK